MEHPLVKRIDEVLYRNWLPFCFLILFYSLILFSFPVNRDVGWDEAVYFFNARKLSGQSTPFDELHFRAILLPLLLQLFGTQNEVWASRLMAGIFFAILNINMFHLGKKFRIGSLPVFVTLFLPFFLYESRAVLTDIPALVFGTWAVMVSSPSWAGILSGMAFLMRYTAGIFFPISLIFHKRKIAPVAAFFLITVVPLLVFAYNQFGNPLHLFLNYPDVYGVLHPSPLSVNLRDPLVKYLYELPDLFTLPVLALFLISLLNPSIELLAWVALVFGAMAFLPTKLGRFLLPAIPAVVLHSFRAEKFLLFLFLAFLLISVPNTIDTILSKPATPSQVVGFYSRENGLLIYTDLSVPAVMFYSNLPNCRSLMWNLEYIKGSYVYVAEPGCEGVVVLDSPLIKLCRRKV